MARGGNAAERADRGREVFELRLSGRSMAQIADALDTSASDAYRSMSDWINKLLTPLAKEARTVEVARLERLLVALEAGVGAGDVAAIRTAAAISNQLADLQGLKMPAQVEHRVQIVDAVDESIMRAMNEFQQPESRPRAIT